MSDPTIADLLRAGTLTDDDVTGAMDAFLSNPTPGEHPLGQGHVIDVNAAVEADPWASAVVRDGAEGETITRDAIRKALLKATPRAAS